ncbi:hypothetical protein D3C87_1867550 [compost metagenome]
MGILTGMRGNLPVEPGDFLVKRLPLRPATHQCLASRAGQFVGAILNMLDEMGV